MIDTAMHGPDWPGEGEPANYRHPTTWDQEFEPLSLPEAFAASVGREKTRKLVDFYGERYSYEALYAEAQAIAAALAEGGIGKGDHVGLFLPNVPLYISAYFGIMMTGATAVNFSPLYTAEELSAQVADSGVRTMFTVDLAALLPTAREVLDTSALERLVVGRFAKALPLAKSALFRLFKRGDLAAIPGDRRIVPLNDFVDRRARFSPVSVDPLTDVALLQYTGGTTGTPKGAMLTHQNLTANARQIMRIDADRGARDVIVGVLPLFHVFANTAVLNRTVMNGGMIAMLPRFDAKATLAAIERTRATTICGVPTMYQALLDAPEIDTTDFSTFRTCISGGAPLPLPLKEKFEAKTGATLVEGYGLTESSGVVSTNPYEAGQKSGTIGQAIPGTRLRLLDKEDPTKRAPQGEPGELAIAGPQIMKGYWNRPEGDGVFEDGYLRTGDVATIDADGFITIVDRIKDMIAVGGFKVFPSQIEDVLLTREGVREALVIGVPDDYLGELPEAYVTLDPDVDLDGEELKDWLNAHVGKHERVRAVVIREELPKTMIGKLDRKALRAEVGA